MPIVYNKITGKKVEMSDFAIKYIPKNELKNYTILTAHGRNEEQERVATAETLKEKAIEFTPEFKEEISGCKCGGNDCCNTDNDCPDTDIDGGSESGEGEVTEETGIIELPKARTNTRKSINKKRKK